MNHPKELVELLEKKKPQNGNGSVVREVDEAVASVSTKEHDDEYLYLIGRPELKDFLRFVKKNAVDPPGEDVLIPEWKAAAKIIAQIEKDEAGAPDNPPITRLDVNGKHEEFLTKLLKDPLIQNGFNTVPTDIALVELDRLVVYQKHIDLTHVAELKAKLGPNPTEEQVFKTCLPYDHPHPPVKWARKGRDSYVFISPSNDLRYLGTMQLKPEQIVDYPHPGSLVGVIGIAVGFGSNFLNAVYTHNRLILNNGSHRAYALRDLGVTHVPCIIQHVHSMDELDVVATSQIVEKSDYFLKHRRPAMLRDYLNPQLRKVMKVNRQIREITVKYSFDESNIPSL